MRWTLARNRFLFQSTPPARGATAISDISFSHRKGISIHAPREGGDIPRIPPHGGIDISIHAPREGGDRSDDLRGIVFGQFQSTPPARGATYDNRKMAMTNDISIHAPREGGDVQP